MPHQYANEGLQTCDGRSIQSFSLKTLVFVKVTEGKERKKFLCDFNAFHCAALRGEAERERNQSEGWQKVQNKDLKGSTVLSALLRSAAN